MYSPDLARDPRIVQMPGMVERLAESEDMEILVALAENPALPDFPPGALAQLLSSPVMEAILQRDDLPWDQPPFAPYAILRGDFASHKRVAQQPDLYKYPQAAWLLARHPDSSVREALAANPAIGQIEGLVEEIARRESDASMQRSLASNPALARCPEIARELATHYDRETRRRLAENPALPALPEDVVRLILQDTNAVLYVLAWRNDLPWDQPPFAPYAILRGDFASHKQVAQRPDLHEYPQAAWHLAGHPFRDVRETLAANPAIGQIEGLVEEIAQRESIYMQRSLASNPALARYPEIARKLATYDDETRRRLAGNPALSALPEDVAQALLQDADIFLHVLARRDDLPWDRPPFAPYAAMRPRPTQPTEIAQQPAAQRQGNDGWIEIKIISGRRYRYLRWREDGKKRSRYLGKMD